MMDTATAASAVSARLTGSNVWFGGVSTDSRTVRPGDLFVAIRGERYDGHAYVAKAFESGAVAAIVDEAGAQQLPPLSANARRGVLAVSDPVKALGRLAAFWRRRFALPVIGIVGSNGKTTVKEMTAAILRRDRGADRVLATAGNFNNAIGLPLTVLRLRATDAVAVFEIGMNHPGETATLAAIAQPTIALINNAQREHQEFMKSVADVAAEHASVLDALPRDGTAVINADDAHASLWRAAVARRNGHGDALDLIDFGFDHAAIVRGQLRDHDNGHVVDVITRQGSATIALRVPGRHNAGNALGAIAAAGAAGARLESAVDALNAFEPIAGRLEAKPTASGALILDDTYNANPDSVRAAIAVLAQATGDKWLVLGDMGEVGAEGVAFHREIGAYARAAGVQRMLAIGDLAAFAVEAYGVGGQHFTDIEALIAATRTALAPRTTVLVKGSRFTRMERVVSALTGASAGNH